MSLYYNIDTGDVREINDALYAAWAVASNPKADVWVLLPAPPSYDPATQHPPAWVNGAWAVEYLTVEELAQLNRKTWEDTESFWAEFTNEEAEAIAVSVHPVVRRLTLMLATWRSRLFSDDPRVSQGLQLLESVGILTPERHAEIITK